MSGAQDDDDGGYEHETTPSLAERRVRYCLELAVGSAPQGACLTLEETLTRAYAFEAALMLRHHDVRKPPTLH